MEGGRGAMPTLSLYFPTDFPDKTLAGHTHRLVVPRPDGGTPEYILGRAAELALTLAVKSISRHHCSLAYSYAANRWSIQDLNSKGGTWLNGKRLVPYTWAPLGIGDRIHLSSNPICIVEDENDTISGDFETIDDDDDGPATVASVSPIAVNTPPASLPADENQYDDAVLLAVQWFTTGSTLSGKAVRFALVVLLVAAATIVVALVVIN